MKKSLLSVAALLMLTVKIVAQDEAIFNSYLLNPVIINPAFTGMNTDQYQIFMHYRNQWTGFPNAPKTFGVTANGPLAPKVGIGGMLISEKFGINNRMRGQLSYAYHYEDSKKGFKAGFGFSTEVHRRRFDPSVVDNDFYDKGDRLIQNGQSLRETTVFDATAGAYAVINDKFTFSLAAPNLIRARVGAGDDTVVKEKTFLRQFAFLVGYKSKTDKMSVEPSIMLRRVYQAGFEVEMNLMARFLDERFLAGVNYRPGTTGAIGMIVGVKQSFFQILYGYSAGAGDFQLDGNRGGHEITLGINLGKGKKQDPTTQPRKRYKN
jgi:type IX secretion system PorP/SprF family membrane protein